VLPYEVYDHEGQLLWDKFPMGLMQGAYSLPVDLDDDGVMEVVTGDAVYRADGTQVWADHENLSAASLPHVANFDEDPEPELLFSTQDGLFLYERDGTLVWGPETPTGQPPDRWTDWQRPATIHDFNGDGQVDFAHASESTFVVYNFDPQLGEVSVVWSRAIADLSGAAGSTAFDLLGDGRPEAIYADESRLFVFDGVDGEELLTENRGSKTFVEYPIIADVDNDGSAEILITSDQGIGRPVLKVVKDADDAWIAARRIYNQHAYSVTNVREDGSLPVEPVDNWNTYNTFRTNLQIEGGSPCLPAG
jgi:hypothetical protein